MMEQLDKYWQKIGVNDGLNWWVVFDGEQFSHAYKCEKFDVDVFRIDVLAELVEIGDCKLHLVGHIIDETLQIHAARFLECQSVVQGQIWNVELLQVWIYSILALCDCIGIFLRVLRIWLAARLDAPPSLLQFLSLRLSERHGIVVSVSLHILILVSI